MNCGISDRKQIPQLKNIWRQCYPEDPDSYIDFFFEKGFSKSIGLSVFDEEAVIGVIYLFPCSILPDEIPAYYFYAGGILPKYRGNGYYRLLIEYAVLYCRQHRREMLCYPAPGLQPFYETMGFTEQYYYQTKTYRRRLVDNEHDLQLLVLSVEELLNMRPLASPGSVIWGPDMMEYIYEEYCYDGGFCHKIVSQDTDEYYLFGKKEADGLRITETSVPFQLYNQLSNVLLRSYDVDSVTIQYPLTREMDGLDTFFSCIGSCHYNNRSKWFALTML